MSQVVASGANAAYPFASAPPSPPGGGHDSAEIEIEYDSHGPASVPVLPLPVGLPSRSQAMDEPVGLPSQAQEMDDFAAPRHAAAPSHYDGGAWTAMSLAEKRKRRWSFGGVTRNVVGAVRRNSGRIWKAAAGDFTRASISNLFGHNHQTRDKGGGAGPRAMPMPEPLLKSTAELRQGGAPTQGSFMDVVWLGFFNSAYAIGRLALLAGELHVHDILNDAPSIHLGLPTLAMLECAIRSAAVAERRELVRFDGRCMGITAAGSEPGADERGIFDDMVALSRRVGDCRLSPAGLASLRARALHGSDAAGPCLMPDEDREVEGLVARAQSVGARVTQIEVYKHSFGRVLHALGDKWRHEADAMSMMQK